MKKMILIFIFSLILPITSSNASCVDQGLLGFIEDKNSIGYLENIFPLCVSQKECGPATNGLEKLNKLDPVKYAYLKGSALANGDCYKQDFKEAERLLTFCSKYSRTCRKQLFNFYTLLGENEKDYLDFALALASEGNRMAYSFLAGYYGDQNSLQGYTYAFFWAFSLFLTNEIAMEKLKKNVEDNKTGLNLKLEDTNYYRLQQWNKDISQLLTNLSQHLSKNLQEKIQKLSVQFVYSPKKDISGHDELAHLHDIYGVSGISTSPVVIKQKHNIASKKKIKNISPPNFGISKELKSILDALNEIRA